MGWASGTAVFDLICDAILQDAPRKLIEEEMIRALITALESHDWDCQQDSRYWKHPLVRKVMQGLHPEWDWSE